MTTLRMLLGALLILGCAAVLAADNLSSIDLGAYEEGIDRADRDVGPQARAMILCATGDTAHEHESPVWACTQSYERAMAVKDYESAREFGAPIRQTGAGNARESAGLAARQKE